MTPSIDQYTALRSGRGFVELADWSSVTLAGSDGQAFLNSFCTNDVKRLATGESCEAFITNVKGKILGHGLVSCRERQLVFITVPDQAPALVAHLERYVIREDVQIRDSTAERAYLLVNADASAVGSIWINWPLLGSERGGLLECPPGEISKAKQALTDQGLVECAAAAFETLRIEAGTPLFGVDFNAENFPQEVGRNERAISFTKGCYLGQETVARIDALGHVNQQLTGVRFHGQDIPAAGTELTAGGKPAGHVTSACFSPRLDAPLALAMVRSQWLAPGTRLASAAGEGEVVTLPV
jgi:folate-binding protein YgfZ